MINLMRKFLRTIEFLPITFVIIVNKISYLKSNSPSGSDLTALDCYILVSLLCVIGTLVEFALVLLVRQSSELFKSSKRQHENDITMHANMVQEFQ